MIRGGSRRVAAPIRGGTVCGAEEKDGPETTPGVEDHTHVLRANGTAVC